MWKRGYKPIILITVGDIAGIGPEIIAKSLADEHLRQSARIFVLGSPKPFLGYFDANRINVVKNTSVYLSSHLNIINIGDVGNIQAGRPDKASAKHAIDALEAAVNIIKNEKGVALVTAPIYKKGMEAAGFDFPGHTEFLSERFNVNVLMAFWGKKLRVATITTHLPLKDVAKSITKKRVEEALNIAFENLKIILKRENTRIALLGLNPHAGEEGKLGDEEINILNPVCEEFRRKGFLLEGPLPADSAFRMAYKGAFDMVVGIYHDQVLAPYKMLYFDEGVNVTLGLPFVRTSPDHGTAFDIAGKGVASEKSFKNALSLAIKMAKM